MYYVTLYDVIVVVAVSCVQGYVDDVFRLTTFYIYYFFVLVIFILFCFAEPSHNELSADGKVSNLKVMIECISR